MQHRIHRSQLTLHPQLRIDRHRSDAARLRRLHLPSQLGLQRHRLNRLHSGLATVAALGQDGRSQLERVHLRGIGVGALELGERHRRRGLPIEPIDLPVQAHVQRQGPIRRRLLGCGGALVLDLQVTHLQPCEW